MDPKKRVFWDPQRIPSNFENKKMASAGHREYYVLESRVTFPNSSSFGAKLGEKNGR